MEDPKNAPDVEKSLDYALTIANSDLNQAKIWSKRIENKIQLVCIRDLKNTCFRHKIDHIRLNEKLPELVIADNWPLKLAVNKLRKGKFCRFFHNIAQNYWKHVLFWRKFINLRHRTEFWNKRNFQLPDFLIRILARFLSRNSRFFGRSKSFQDLIKKFKR